MTQQDMISAVPSKRIYRSIISDYGLKTSICELIDNAYDAWYSSGENGDLNIEVKVDFEPQIVFFKDNSGGVEKDDLRKLVSPGESSISGEDTTIGVFGIGCKRAAVAIANHVRITTRKGKKKTYRIFFDDEWLRSDSWDLPVSEVYDIDEGTTEFLLSNLRFSISKEDVADLKNHLEAAYAYLLQEKRMNILLNGKSVGSFTFENWAYPPGFEPRKFNKVVKPENREEIVKFSILSGLTIEGGSVGGDYGVFVYCNRRMIGRALRTPELGFIKGIAGVPHPRMSLARIILFFEGPSDLMPWNSSKSEINYNHFLFQSLRHEILEVVKNTTSLSKRLQPDFDEKVKPYTSGQIIVENISDTETIRACRLPDLPPIRKNLRNQLIEVNKKLAETKPWTRGLCEGFIADEIVSKQKKLDQKNRISLIILDSTLEIALKDYLANEVEQPISDANLSKLFNNRIEVHKEVKKHILKDSDKLWKKVNFYYKMRCDLVHRRISLRINDDDISNFRKIVQRILKEAFGIRFPKSKK